MTPQQINVRSFVVGLSLGAFLVLVAVAIIAAAVLRLVRPRAANHYLPTAITEG